ncbi:bifunctional riboflavin kinase/FAD synthetase [Acidisoma cladoniae]|jgi:riboflavin kinase/FMN adenylyltransferase|uniref:bifunctional riboflavin kinase/FAD synthetase n=1 Tax=Acidisoma cladoniae TaxID=3040935 RepID=UPI0025517FE8|nr:bifunctional riboflavin kinase/FAD synthetase [Acidisoma sp. PAMC 29798]
MSIRIIGPDDPVPPEARGATVALGNFDGVHLGHAAVLRTAHAARPEAPLAVLTFEPHPRAFFRPDDPPFRLSLLTEKAAALGALNVAWLFTQRFDHAFSQQTAEDFVTRVLHDRIGASHLVCGADFAFGHRRGGDVAFLAARAERLGIGLSIAPAFTDLSGPISSTRIRRLLQDGYPERANALLGRPWTIRAVVAHGDKRGRTIGFPTANLALGAHLEPARGVYAVTVDLPDGSHHDGVANIGHRPTVNDTLESRLEVNIFDFDGDLYDQEIGVSLHSFLRAEQKFASFDALRVQIAADADAARALLTFS